MSLASCSKLYKFFQENSNEESYRHAIQLPQDTRLEDWLSVVTIEIFDNLTRIYSYLSKSCIDTACPIMCIGLSHEYLWNEYQDSNSSIKHKKIHCSAPKYIDLFITFVKETISNASIFPTESSIDMDENQHEYPSNFLSIIHFICKQIFRVFGHLYCNHLSLITSLQLDLYLNICFKHFLYFIEEFELIQSTQLKPLHGYIQISLGRPFGKMYRETHLDITAFSSIHHTSSQISHLSLPKTPTSKSNNTVINHSNNSLHDTIIKKDISIEIGTEYKDIEDTTSVSFASSMNSLTPYPTKRNRSVYEYVFHKNNNSPTLTTILKPLPPEQEEEEKASQDYMDNTPGKNIIGQTIHRTNKTRECKIIRSNTKTNVNENTVADNYLPRISLLSNGDNIDGINPIQIVNKNNNYNTFAFSPYTLMTNDNDIEIKNDKKEITPTPEAIVNYNKCHQSEHDIDSPSFRDVVFYRSQVRKLQSEVNVLKGENKELKLNGCKPKKKVKKKKKKKPETEANMAQLVDIMNSMNEQITKLAQAVTDVVHSTDDDEKIEYDDDDDHKEELKDSKNYLKHDLREYLLGKVLTAEQ